MDQVRVSPNVLRCLGLVDVLFALWMFSLVRKLKNPTEGVTG